VTLEKFYKPVAYHVADPLPPEIELWFWNFLSKWSSYVEVDATTGKLVGYGIPAGKNDDFLFWLHVGLLSNNDEEEK
jgi:hypothetical protein